MKHFNILSIGSMVLTALTGCGTKSSCNDMTGGVGAPSITFKYFLPKGSINRLRGQALHVIPSGFCVARYVHAEGVVGETHIRSA